MKLKRYIKYLVIVFINFIVLSILLLLWTDKVELFFNESIRDIEYVKIVAITFLTLILIRFSVYFFRKFNLINPKTKLKYTIVLTLIASSFLYFDYSKKLITNRIINREIRNCLGEKVKPNLNGLANGNKAENLTFEEYELIRKINWFPKIPKEAKSINYLYEYDGFLPDHSFILSYNVPKNMKIKIFDINEDDFSQSQTVEILKTSKKVEYSESEQ
jgi:hypothetical protein